KKIGGRPFDKATLYVLLTNPIYTGKMRYKDELHDGEHEPIVDQELFDQVQRLLKSNGRTGGLEIRNKYGALLRGLLRCKCCGTAMAHTFTGKSKKPFYRYYRCTRAIKNGRSACPVGSIPAAEIERVVVDEVRGLAKDKALLTQVLTEAHASIHDELSHLQRDRADLRKERKRHHAELQQLVTQGSASSEVTAR